MIIRRRRTRNFTILENEVVEDTRLALDEIGLLTWLRSRPDNWEVSRFAIGKRFKIGRDKVARIFQSLIQCGWMRREETLPGEPARYIVLDEPGTEVELTAAEVAEVEDREPQKDREAEGVASLSQSGFPATDEPSAGGPSTENPTGIIRTDSDQSKTPNPLSGGDQVKIDEVLEKDLDDLARTYPIPITDLPKLRKAMAARAPDARRKIVSAGAAYADFIRAEERKGRKRAVKDAHRWVGSDLWQGFVAAAERREAQQANPIGLYEPASREGRAILALAKIARYSPLRVSDGRVSFRGEVTGQLLAMADLPEEGWQTFQRGSAGFGSWRDLIRKIFANCNLPALTEITAPWLFAPSTAGMVYDQATGPPPNHVDGTLATAEDLKEFAKG